MAIFTKSAGYSPADGHSLVVFMLSAVLVIFFITVVRGAYVGKVKGQLNAGEAWTRIVVAVGVLTFVAIRFINQ